MGKPVTVYQKGHDESIPIIEYMHVMTHEGKVYAAHYENLAPTSGLTTYVHIKTGAKDLHVFQSAEALGGVLSIQWYGAPEVGTAGTVISVINRNRHHKDDELLSKFYLNSTVTTVGTVLFGARCVLASATVQSKSNSALVEGVERILLPNQDYLCSFITRVASMMFALDWVFYEEPC